MGGSSSKEASAPQASLPSSATPFSEPKKEDYNSPLPNKTLPKDLQQLVDKDDENYWDQIYEGNGPESTDTALRYAAYARRFRTILLSAHRYVAYTSDIGESFRPVAHPYLVTGAYAVSWAYLIGDVSHEGYKAYVRQQKILHPEWAPGAKAAEVASSATEAAKNGPSALKERLVQDAKNAADGVQEVANLPPGSGHVPAIEDYRTVMAQRAVFQSIASMGLPAFTIHSIVKYSGKALKGSKNVTIRTWGPIGLGLAAVPFLPYMFDKPVEEAVEYTFHEAFKYFGGPDAVRHSHPIGREQILEDDNKARKAIKEKEL